MLAVLVAGGVLGGAALLWWAQRGAVQVPLADNAAVSGASPGPAPQVRPVPTPGAQPVAGSGAPPVVDAGVLRARYRDTGGRVDEQYRGARLRLSGPVVAVEDTESGVLVVALAAGEDLPPLRVLVDGPHHGAARGWAPGQRVVVDCLHRGLVMGEPLFSDCRPLPG